MIRPATGRPGERPILLVATRSVHKLRELRELLRLDHAEVVGLDESGIAGDPEENGATFEANAALKARYGARASGLATLADDSGLEVDALDGGPGVRTRRYAGEHATDEDNNRKLLAALDGLPTGAAGRTVRVRVGPRVARPGRSARRLARHRDPRHVSRPHRRRAVGDRRLWL